LFVTNRFQKLELEPSQQQHTPTASAKTTTSATAQQFRQDPLHDSAHWMQVAEQNRRRGLFEEALRHYSRAVELDRALVRGWVGQVQMLIALDEFKEAELWARKALELFRNNGELLAARAHALCRVGDLKSAQASCDAALAQPGESAYPWIVRGDLMLARRDPVEEHCFNKATQLDPDWLVLLEIAAIYLYYTRNAKALTRLRQAVEKAPDEPFCWFRQGECEAVMGLEKSARRSFKQCLDLEPKNESARQRLNALDEGKGWFRKTIAKMIGEG
jgi:tetratricopeptide (TPR) repeat protein